MDPLQFMCCRVGVSNPLRGGVVLVSDPSVKYVPIDNVDPPHVREGMRKRMIEDENSGKDLVYMLRKKVDRIDVWTEDWKKAQRIVIEFGPSFDIRTDLPQQSEDGPSIEEVE